MSDLRTRIAAAIQAQWTDLTLTNTWDEDCLILADAVIRELGLRQERQQGPYNFMYRYATELMTDG